MGELVVSTDTTLHECPRTAFLMGVDLQVRLGVCTSQTSQVEGDRSGEVRANFVIHPSIHPFIHWTHTCGVPTQGQQMCEARLQTV